MTNLPPFKPPSAFEELPEFEHDCEANPVPPETKFTGKHLISLDGSEAVRAERLWLIPVSVGTIALIVGILIGRFLLP